MSKDKSTNGWEKRSWNGTVGCRQDKKGKVQITGLGIPFNKLSENLSFWPGEQLHERVDPKALDGVDLSDVYSFFNHNQNIVLGRTKSKTMKIEIKKDGAHYTVTPPEAHSAIVENIQRGDVDGSSWLFRIKDEKIERVSETEIIRTILKFEEIKEIGPVVGPAYGAADVKVLKRKMEEWRSFEKRNQEGETSDDDTTKDQSQSPGDNGKGKPNESDSKSGDTKNNQTEGEPAENSNDNSDVKEKGKSLLETQIDIRDRDQQHEEEEYKQLQSTQK